ncbi:MAG TPA: Fur family transcriptional regulator [Polyangiales bacterium]|nr:Fur family transcriptional regulator [Polyangiales bacterium]
MQAASKLNRSGLKATTPRMVVLDVFEQNPERHFKADDVVRCLEERKVDLGLPTVYRVLAQLTEVGLIARSIFDFARASYELQAPRPHGHCVCVSCGSIEEFADEIIEARQEQAAAKLGFEVSERHEILYGRCAKCRAKGARVSS